MVKGIDDSCLVSDLCLVFEPALYRGEQAKTYSKTRTPIACIDTRPDKLKLAHCIVKVSLNFALAFSETSVYVRKV